MSELVKKRFNLPTEWDMDVLHNLCNLINDGTHFTPRYLEIGVPFLRVTDVQENAINFEGLKFISEEEHTLLSKRCKPEKGDLLLSKNGSIGISKIVDWDWEFSIFVSLALIKPIKSLLDVKFLQYYLDSELTWWQIFRRAKQGTVTNLHLEEIREIEVPKVPIPEQRKIARILSTVDAVIEKTEAAIAKYKAIKSGMMRDLFTRGIDQKTGKLRPRYEDAPELYKESELGWVPMEWEVDTLENSTDYVDYRGKTPPKSEFGIFLVTARNIKDGFIDYEISKEYIPDYAFESAMSRGKAEIGDVVITTEAPMGNVAQIDRSHIALAQRVIKYRGKSNKLINDYLSMFLMSDGFQRRLIAESTGSTVLGIKGSRLHKLFIAMPEKNEQAAISKMIKTQDGLLTDENENLHKHQQLKDGLMSDLLTGKVRAKYNENEKVEVM